MPAPIKTGDCYIRAVHPVDFLRIVKEVGNQGNSYWDKDAHREAQEKSARQDRNNGVQEEGRQT